MLRLGRVPVIFVTSAALAHEALVEKGVLFAARPHLPSRKLFTNNYRNINSASYGAYWRAMRRNLVREMLGSAKILSFKPTRERVLDQMILRLRGEAEHNEGVVAVYGNCRVAMFQLLLFICMGFHMEEEAILQVSALLEEILPFHVGVLGDFYPFLSFLDRKKVQRRGAVREKQVHLFTSLIEQHQELQKLGQLTPGSYLETLLHMDAPTHLSNADLITLCSEFMVAGTDTTVTTLEWTMAHLVMDPPIQTKLYHHIHDAVGNRPVDENDLPNLPFLQAVIKETLRLHPPGHFLLPHAVSKPCRLGGYDIPPHAVVNFNITSISRDAKIWEEPLKYRPERILTADVDITGTKQVTMVPFGAGRRICPGLGLALMHTELFVARLVQAYEWSTPQIGETVDLSERTVFTVLMKHPLKALIRERTGTCNVHGDAL